MDAITAAALAVNSPLLHSIGMLIDNVWVYAAVVLALLFIGERRGSKRVKILFSLTLAILAVTALKPLLAVDRPCTGQVSCPSDYSFPSLHAAVAFLLMIAFLDKRSFAFYLLFALFVSFTRINLDVHTFRDVAGALVIAVVAYYVTDMIWERLGKGGASHG
jgi:membrane-associated phospholipid phosphatase